MSSLWQALGTPLQPSVTCVLRVVTTPQGSADSVSDVL
jgi:hypothetical protein